MSHQPYRDSITAEPPPVPAPVPGDPCPRHGTEQLGPKSRLCNAVNCRRRREEGARRQRVTDEGKRLIAEAEAGRRLAQRLPRPRRLIDGAVWLRGWPAGQGTALGDLAAWMIRRGHRAIGYKDGGRR